MNEFLIFTVIGLATGAVYAIAASGLVVTYTTTGIFNFAHGAFGMMAAFVYWQLRFEWEWPAPIALFVVLAVLAPAFGAFVELTIMGRLYGTAEVTRVVISISLLLALIGAAIWIWPSETRAFRTFYQDSEIGLGSINVTYHQLISVALAVALAVGIRLLLYRTRAGVVMRAVVDNRELAQLNGGRPRRTAMFSWALGSSLAALSGILIAPVLSLSPVPLTLLVINAYAAAIVGRLKSLPLTFLGATALGLAEAYTIGYIPTDIAWLSGFRPAIPVLFLFAALLLMPQVQLRGSRVDVIRERFTTPTIREAAIGFTAVVLVFAAVSGFLSTFDSLTIARGLGLAIIALSLVPLVGFAGEISLAQMTFAGIGAMVMAHTGDGGSPIGFVWAIVICGVVGGIIALPALRLRGIYLALATAAFAVAMERWIFNISSLTLFGWEVPFFPGGGITIDRLTVFGYEFSSTRSQIILLASVWSVMGMGVIVLRRSAYGRRLRAMKASPAACATLGLDLTKTKLSIFSLSAAMAGVGGALYAQLVLAATPDNFGFTQSLSIMMMVTVGGVALVSGSLFAGLMLGAALPLLATHVPALENVVLVLPGLIGIGMGRNPSGQIMQISALYKPLLRQPVIAAVSAGLLVVTYGLRVTDVIGNWAFALITVAILVVTPVVGALVRRLHTPIPGEETPPIESAGLDRTFADSDLTAMEDELRLEPLIRAMGAGR